jgi:hypothetical protein
MAFRHAEVIYQSDALELAATLWLNANGIFGVGRYGYR